MDFKVPNTLAEQIANYLAERIMTGQIQPGKRIQEATLAGELKVSRASVKEALYTLERWHLVEITPRKGASASKLDANHASELYDVYMHLLLMLAPSILCGLRAMVFHEPSAPVFCALLTSRQQRE